MHGETCQSEEPPPPCFGSWLPLSRSPCGHLALTLLKRKHWSLTWQCFPAVATAAGRQDQGSLGLCFFQDDPWNAELVMLLASASKEASQEQNVFYLSVSNWSGPAFNSTLRQYFFEHQTGMHLSSSGCRVNGLNAAASKFWLQALLKIVTSYWLYITCTKFSHSGPIFTIEMNRTGYSSQVQRDQEEAWTRPSFPAMV